MLETLGFIVYLLIGGMVVYLTGRQWPDYFSRSSSIPAEIVFLFWPVIILIGIPSFLAEKGSSDGVRAEQLKASERKELENYRKQALQELDQTIHI